MPTSLSLRDRAGGGPLQAQAADSHLLGRLMQGEATGEGCTGAGSQGAVGLHRELDAEPSLGLLEHGRISQPLLGADCYADVLLVAVRAPDRSGGYVGQQLGQLHVDLVEVGRGGVEQPDTTEVLVDVAQGVPSGKVGEQHPLTATYRFQAEPSPNSMCRARRVV